MLAEAIDSILKIPPVIIGALIAALISLIGVLAANKSSLNRLHAQHENDRKEATLQRLHDATQKEEDRKAAIRREVYIDSVEQAHALLGAIGGLFVKPLDFSGVGDAEPLQIFLKANAKVWLVADSAAALLSRELTGQMSELYMKTLASAYPSRVEFQKILDINALLVRAEEDVRRIDVKNVELKESNSETAVRDGALVFLAREQEYISSLKTSRQQIFDSMMPGRVAHMYSLFENMRSVQETLVRLVSSLRKEIHLSANEDEFLQQLLVMEKRALAMVERSAGISKINE